jgi:hypothetical protein
MWADYVPSWSTGDLCPWRVEAEFEHVTCPAVLRVWIGPVSVEHLGESGWTRFQTWSQINGAERRERGTNGTGPPSLFLFRYQRVTHSLTLPLYLVFVQSPVVQYVILHTLLYTGILSE